MGICSSSTSSSSSNWSSLPDDALDLIIKKLIHDDLSDYFRFSTVCKSWNSIALKHRAQLNIPLQLPWLLMITSNSNVDNINGEPQLCFYNYLMSSEIPNIKLPYNFSSRMCCGSSHGWLVFMEDNLTLIVLNPLSGDTVRLPRLIDFLDLQWYDEDNVIQGVVWYENEEVEKVILSRDPCLGSFEVLAICSLANAKKIVAHLKYGDECWSYSPMTNLVKVAFYKDWIFGLSCDGILTSLAIDPLRKVIKIAKDIAPKPRRSGKWLLKAAIKTVMDIKPRIRVLPPDFVQSTNGDLLIVKRFILSGPPRYAYKIQRLRTDSKGRIKLVPIVNLGNDALFLGDYGSASISAPQHRNCKPNFIYDYYYIHKQIREFNFKDGSFRYKNTSCRHELVLSWYMPSMKL